MSDSDGESYGTQPVGSASEVPKKRNSVTSKGRLCNRCSFLYFRAESSRYGLQEDISEGADGRSRRLTFPEFSSSIKFSHYKPPAIIDNYRVRDDLPELPRLRESALAGCDFCGILREALIQDTRRRNRSNKTIDIHKLMVLRAFDAGLPTDTNPDRRFAAIEVSWFSDYKLYGTIYFKLCGNADDPLTYYLGTAYPHPEEDMLSARTVERIKGYVNHCVSNHQECGGLREGTSLPTRLIKIEGNRERKSIHLVDTSRAHLSPAETQYAALSYRWGDRPFLSTTRANLEAYMLEIPFSDLPQGFKDVVDICLKLGIRYLWIDAICIIQADSDDWALESTKMHTIYANSWLTIALPRTESPYNGFLKQPQDPSRPIIQLSYAFDPLSGAEGSLFIQRLQYKGKLDYTVSNPYLASEDNVDASPWNDRGWTLQERLLSTRILYVGVNEMLGLGHICCRRSMDWGREAHPDIVPPRYKSLERLRIRPPFNTLPTTPGTLFTQPPTRSHALYRDWYTLIEDYSCRKLTKPDEDKLAAISGIARLNAHVLGPYIAGLWINDIAMGLMWQSPSIARPGASPQPLRPSLSYRAPSWAWSANDGEVEFCRDLFDDDPKSDIVVEDWGYVPQYARDPYGQLSDKDNERAFLKIKGRLGGFTINDQSQISGSDQRWISLPARFNNGISGQRDLPDVGLVTLDYGEEATTSSSTTLSGSYRDVFLLRVALAGRQGEYSDRYYVGLVLRRTANLERPEYERIGTFSELNYDMVSQVLSGCVRQTVYLV